MREPALADEELEHRANRPDRLQHLARVRERVSRTEEAALATDKTDDRAPVRREGTLAHAAFVPWNHEALIDGARVEERLAKRPRLRFVLGQLRHTASVAAGRVLGLPCPRRDVWRRFETLGSYASRATRAGVGRSAEPAKVGGKLGTSPGT